MELHFFLVSVLDSNIIYSYLTFISSIVYIYIYREREREREREKESVCVAYVFFVQLEL